MTAAIRVGVSACLLGASVRYDGGHKRDRYLTDVVGRYFEWVPVCPEVEAGLGTPRPPIRLEASGRRVRVVEPQEGRDLTRTLQAHARKRVRALAALDLSGYVLKAGSPSCGLRRVPVWSERGSRAIGAGVFAAELVRRFGTLPVEEEGRLHDVRIRENWIERVFAYERLRRVLAGRLSRGRLVAFQAVHELQLRSHSPAGARALERLVARAAELPDAELRARYEAGFMAALAKHATPSRHATVLRHALGRLRDRLHPVLSRELRTAVDDYARGLVPRVVPLTMIRYYAEREGITGLAGQVYLDPHPKELLLRNQV